MEEEYSPAELIKERQRRVDEMNGLVALPAGITARQFMQMVMRGEIDPLPKQMNAAKVLIEYEEAKLTAVAVGHMDGTSFAAQLERCLARSEAARQGVAPLPPAALLPPVEHSREEVRGPFVRRRKNLR
jgi:hypothetical protein